MYGHALRAPPLKVNGPDTGWPVVWGVGCGVFFPLWGGCVV